MVLVVVVIVNESGVNGGWRSSIVGCLEALDRLASHLVF